MKAAKRVAIVIAVYVGLVVLFEAAIGVLQPAGERTLVITTSDGEGNRDDRVLSAIESGGKLYVAANHWPRSWYRQAMANPKVQVALGGQPSASYLAVPIDGAEFERVDGEHGLPIPMRVLTGFPPRRMLRLDPE